MILINYQNPKIGKNNLTINNYLYIKKIKLIKN